jgi:SAM-dependent methyltransferase
MTLKPEEAFYKRHTGGYSGTVQNALHHINGLFEPGGRYSLVKEYIEKVESHSSPQSVLEIGCGNGDTLRWLHQHYRLQSLQGFDIALEGAISEGQLRLMPADLNQALLVSDQSVDIIIAMMIIEHLFDPFAAFKEVARCLSPKGRAFINLPLITSIKNRLRLLFGRMPQTSVPYRYWFDERHWDGFHLHNFTLKSIKDLCNYSGLEIIQLRSVGSYHRIKSRAPSLLADEVSFEVARR